MAPHHYRKKLVDNIPFEYDVYTGTPILLGKSVVSVHVAVVLPNGKRSEANGTAIIEDENGEITAKAAMYAVREAQSVGLKLALTNFGMGLELYFKRDDEEEAPPKKQPAKSAPAKHQEVQDEEEEEDDAPPAKRKTASSGKPAGGGWESKREKFTVPIGKHKGETYAEVEASWLEWAVDNLDDNERNKNLLKCVNDEIAYRKKNGEWNPKKKTSNKPTRKRSIGDDEEEEF